MTAPFPLVPLGDVLTKSESQITIDPVQRYRQVTVRLWGKGVALRDEVDGTQIAAPSRYIVRSNQFVLSRIDARNGAFGLVPDTLDGAVVSNDFPVFTVNAERMIPSFLDWMSKTRGFVDLCRAASEGTTNRVRLKEDKFLAMQIPLPPLAEQRRIVARIEALAAKVAEARGLRRQAMEATETLFLSATREVFDRGKGRSFGEYTTIQSGYAFKSDWFTDAGIRLVRNVNIGHGRIDWHQTVRIPEERRREFERFELSEGDILISLDRPIISTGVKVACVSPRDVPSLLLQRVGRVRFTNGAVLPEYAFAWLQSPAFISAIDPGRSNGVPHISPKDIERIPFVAPPIPEQRRIVAYLDGVQAKVDAVRRLQAETAAELDAMLPAVLDRAFRGAL